MLRQAGGCTTKADSVGPDLHGSASFTSCPASCDSVSMSPGNRGWPSSLSSEHGQLHSQLGFEWLVRQHMGSPGNVGFLRHHTVPQVTGVGLQLVLHCVPLALKLHGLQAASPGHQSHAYHGSFCALPDWVVMQCMALPVCMRSQGLTYHARPACIPATSIGTLEQLQGLDSILREAHTSSNLATGAHCDPRVEVNNNLMNQAHSCQGPLMVHLFALRVIHMCGGTKLCSLFLANFSPERHEDLHVRHVAFRASMLRSCRLDYNSHS